MSKELFEKTLCLFAQEQPDDCLIIADGAASHRSTNLRLPDPIKEIKILPAYCPELNPVERFFREVRRWTKNTIAHTLDQIEQQIFQYADGFKTKPNQLASLTQYHWF